MSKKESNMMPPRGFRTSLPLSPPSIGVSDMKKREALRILLESAQRDVKGNGRGFRTSTLEYRNRVKEAVKKIWKDAYGREISDNDLDRYYGWE